MGFNDWGVEMKVSACYQIDVRLSIQKDYMLLRADFHEVQLTLLSLILDHTMLEVGMSRNEISVLLFSAENNSVFAAII